ncbi:MAG: DUF6350 family protein [Arcanobacterium sp.]
MSTAIDLTRHLYIARGTLAAPFFSWLGVFVLVMLGYTLTASAPMLGDINWQDAAQFATGWWTTIYGGRTQIDGATLSLMPLTLTAIVSYATYYSLRPRGIESWQDVGAAAVGHAGIVAVIGLLGQAQGYWWFAVIGALLLGGVLACAAGREILLYPLPWWQYVDSARTRITWIFRLLAGLAALALLVGLITGWSRITDLYGYYYTNIIGSIGLVLIQLAYLPSFIMWALAWVLGAGFAVGEGSHFSSISITSQPLPAIPILGALPTPDVKAWWILIFVVAAAGALGAWLERRLVSAGRRVAFANSAIAIGVVGLTLSVAGQLSAGAIGPGRMSVVGPQGATVFGFFLLFVGVPFVLGTYLAHPTTVSAIDESTRSARENVSQKINERRVAKEKVADSAGSATSPDDAQTPDDARSPDDAAGTPDEVATPGAAGTPDEVTTPGAAANGAEESETPTSSPTHNAKVDNTADQATEPDR